MSKVIKVKNTNNENVNNENTSLEKLSKEELIKLIVKVKESSSETVKSKVINILKASDFISLDEIATRVNTNKNVVSSILTSIRKDDNKIISIKIDNVNYIKMLNINNKIDKEIITQIETITK